jgi:urease accessory protein
VARVSGDQAGALGGGVGSDATIDASRDASRAPAAAPSWHGRLQLRYTRDGARTVAHDAHEGPLRVLKALYPEGHTVCHHVLVHPPGGVAGGDRLDIDATLECGAHALVTTPGATRFYRSAGAAAVQDARLALAEGARLEWLPMAAIAFNGCRAENRVRFTLAEGAQMIGADVLALGLPTSDAPFARGVFTQHLAWPGQWLERGRIDASDARLLQSPLGLAGRTVMATLWFAAGTALADGLREALLDAAREGAAPLEGASAPAQGLVVWRALGDAVEPLWARVAAVRAAWRRVAWGLDANEPRVWRT